MGTENGIYNNCVGNDRVLLQALIKFMSHKNSEYALKDGWMDRSVWYGTCNGAYGGESILVIQVEGSPPRATLMWDSHIKMVVYAITDHAPVRIANEDLTDYTSVYNELTKIMENFAVRHRIAPRARPMGEEIKRKNQASPPNESTPSHPVVDA